MNLDLRQNTKNFKQDLKNELMDMSHSSISSE